MVVSWAVRLVRRRHAQSTVHVLHELRVQVLEHLDLLALHPFVVLVRLLRVRLLAVVLDHHGVYVTHLDGVLHTWRIHKSTCNMRHLVTVPLVKGRTSLTELLEVAYLS